MFGTENCDIQRLFSIQFYFVLKLRKQCKHKRLCRDILIKKQQRR